MFVQLSNNWKNISLTCCKKQNKTKQNLRICIYSSDKTEDTAIGPDHISTSVTFYCNTFRVTEITFFHSDLYLDRVYMPKYIKLLP